MPTINYSFSESDIETILYTLTILPTLELEDTDAQASINYQCCLSASEKLSLHRTDILPNEFRVILASLEAAQLINQGGLNVDSKVRKECSNYLFSINKLVSVFEKQLS